MARAPAASAPMQADIELCSDSTGTNSVFTSPLATYWAKYWGISVEGVIGKARHHIGVDLLHGKGNGLVAGKTVRCIFMAVRPPLPVIAPKGHTVAQMPQPLQWW